VLQSPKEKRNELHLDPSDGHHRDDQLEVLVEQLDASLTLPLYGKRADQSLSWTTVNDQQVQMQKEVRKYEVMLRTV
jgi:hypothetical protein